MAEHFWTEARIAKAVKLWDRGMRQAEIAAKFRVDVQNVNSLMNRHRARFARRRGGAGPRAARVWTESRLAEASRLWATDMPMTEIAAAVGVTERAMNQCTVNHRDLFPLRGKGHKGVRAAAQRVERQAEAEAIEVARARFWTDEKLDRFEALRAEGQTLAQIAPVFATSVGALRMLMQAHRGRFARGRTPRARETFWTDAVIARAVALHRQDHTNAEIARSLGTERNAVSGFIHRHPELFAPRPKRQVRLTVKASAPPVRTVPVTKPVARANAMALGSVTALVKTSAALLAAIEGQPAPGAGNSKRLMELGNCDCRYIVRGTGFMAEFCAAPQDGGSSYCAHHRHACEAA